MNTGVQRSGATPPAARTATTEAVGATRAMSSARERIFPVSPWRTTFPTWRRRQSPISTISRGRSSAPWSSAGPDTSTSSFRAPSAGARARATRSRWPAWPRRPASFPCSRPRTARSPQCPRSATECPVEAYLSIQSRYAHLFGEHPRPDIVARIQAIADSNIANYGLVVDDADDSTDTEVDRLMERPSPSRSTSARATPTGPARGASSDRCTSTGCHRATMPVRRARTSRAGSTMPSPGTMRRPGVSLVEDNPFPAVMGRICYHPCETACNRAQLDEAVGHQRRRALPR